jgi:hypothetical protein
MQERMRIGHRLVQMPYRHGTNECILRDMSNNRECRILLLVLVLMLLEYLLLRMHIDLLVVAIQDRTNEHNLENRSNIRENQLYPCVWRKRPRLTQSILHR